MSKIISIGTAVPRHRHRQQDISAFMQQVYALDAAANRKMKFLYQHSGIETRYSVISDYSRGIADWKFYPRGENLEPFPSLELRMAWYQQFAASLSVDAIRNCLGKQTPSQVITHLITVSCTGMSAPGLDLQVMELLGLPKATFRTSVNFMGCYAAVHALKLADAICKADANAKVMIVCTELCTLHFQKQPTIDNIASSLLFADGSAAVLVTGNGHSAKGIQLQGFYSEIVPQGKNDMSWELSSTGFLMTLSGYVPKLIEQDFELLLNRAMQYYGTTKESITNWCIHPGGKRILQVIQKCAGLSAAMLQESYAVLKDYGNMSSATILFVLRHMMDQLAVKRVKDEEKATILAVAFGPGLTMETMLLCGDDSP